MPPWMLQALWFVAVMVGVYVAVIFFTSQQEKRKRAKRVERLRHPASKSAISKDFSAKTSLRRTLDEGKNPLVRKIVQALPQPAALQDKLEQAGKGISAGKFIYLCLVLCFVVGFVMMVVLQKPPLLSILTALVVSAWLPKLYLNFLANRRLKQFIGLFPDAIDLIVRGLRAGLPVGESINMVAREVQAPVGPIFASIGDSVRLGVTLEKALLDTARKLHCTEFNFFTTSIILQRETGGNLGEILGNLSQVLRSRLTMRMKIKAMSSEARASAIIVGSLPFLVFLALYFISYEYVSILWNDYRGNVAGLFAIGSLSGGAFIMYKMTQFEI